MDLKVLVVDDDEGSRFVTRQMLELKGCEVFEAETGIQAIKELEKDDYDFVMMDITMPETDGLDAVRWVRDMPDEQKNNVPVFALTSHSGKEQTKEILASGMSEHIVKPLSIDKLDELIEKYF